MISIGIIACFLAFGHLADRLKLKGRFQNMILLTGVASIAVGFVSAILFQALYNIDRDGGFEIVKNTGATFYGGLVGGAVTFLAVYFTLGGVIMKKGGDRDYHKKKFFDAAACVAPAIALAHGFGRLGCLFAGCCHGLPTDMWCGISMHGSLGYQRYVPVQLFEALFLFFLFGVMFFRARKERSYNLPIYMSAYGVWRFVIEFARADYRGTIGFEALTPSQFIAILMVLGGAAVFAVEKRLSKRGVGENSQNFSDNNEDQCE